MRGKGLLVTAATIALPLGGIVGAWYLWSRWRKAKEDPDREDARTEEPGFFARARAALVPLDVEEGVKLSRRILAVDDRSPAAAYAEEISHAARMYDLDPLLIVAVGMHESGWGFAPHYVPRGGPDGAGDDRVRKRPKGPASSGLLGSWDAVTGILSPPRWPNRAVGFGLGLMQIDAEFHWDWATEGMRWMEPKANIEYGAGILAANLSTFDGDVKAAVLAYNRGAGAVKKLIASGEFSGTESYIQSVLSQYDRYASGRAVA